VIGSPSFLSVNYTDNYTPMRAFGAQAARYRSIGRSARQHAHAFVTR